MAKEYIEREAALESLCTGCEYVPIDEKENCPYRFTGCQEYANIFAIPAADVGTVRHGRWIKYAPYNSDMMTCSKCEKYWILDGDQYDYHYCPNCGARMDGDSE